CFDQPNRRIRTRMSGGVGSGRQGCNLAGESPAISIARFGYVAIPQFLWVTTSPLRGVNGLAALKEFSGGCNLGA
ncbi:MAG: hypothetical protein J7K15_00055, partial [Deltaproteobacteria bacterium]|nr:hypothetical protein [Deltaproteobacteria bacterium]